MDKISMFGENGRYRNYINDEFTAYIHEDVGMELYHARASLFEAAKCRKTEEHHNDAYSYSAYSDGEGAIFMCYYHNIRELTYVIENNNSYFSYSDTPRSTAVTVQITRISLEDFGMSYVIRLSDGRFIIIDGGCELECEADKLHDCLKKGSVYEKPVIAAWILTHPHPNNFCCFIAFTDKYGDSVEIEKFLFNFPEADDTKHYPALAGKDGSLMTDIPRMLERIRRTGAPVYTPHTGQVYRIGDAVCEILACIDDTMHRSSDIDSASLVIRMELAGQVILWGADAAFEAAQLSEKFGSYLRSDIL